MLLDGQGLEDTHNGALAEGLYAVPQLGQGHIQHQATDARFQEERSPGCLIAPIMPASEAPVIGGQGAGKDPCDLEQGHHAGREEPGAQKRSSGAG